MKEMQRAYKHAIAVAPWTSEKKAPIFAMPVSTCPIEIYWSLRCWRKSLPGKEKFQRRKKTTE